MSEVIDTEGMIIINLEEGESAQIVADTAKKNPGRQIAISIGTRLTAQSLANMLADKLYKEMHGLPELTVVEASTHRGKIIGGDFWTRGESLDPKRTTNGLPYRKGKGRSR